MCHVTSQLCYNDIYNGLNWYRLYFKCQNKNKLPMEYYPANGSSEWLWKDNYAFAHLLFHIYKCLAMEKNKICVFQPQPNKSNQSLSL